VTKYIEEMRSTKCGVKQTSSSRESDKVTRTIEGRLRIERINEVVVYVVARGEGCAVVRCVGIDECDSSTKVTQESRTSA
jgi:hypothetical protein